MECIPPNHIKFDFLGKDSIRYENTVDVELAVYKAVQAFIKVDAKGKREYQLYNALRCMPCCWLHSADVYFVGSVHKAVQGKREWLRCCVL